MKTSSPDPANLLAAWTALEVLAPQTFEKAADLAIAYNGSLFSLDNPRLPWEESTRPPSGFRNFYQVVLGTLSYEAAIHSLLDQFADPRPERPSLPGEAILAAVLLDAEGRLAGADAVSISSFGWGFPVALQGSLSKLADWAVVERELAQALADLLQHTDDQGKLLPVQRGQLQQARTHLLQALALPPEFVTTNRFAIRCSVSVRNLSNPEPLLLNSFFLGDLAWGRQLLKEQQAPVNLQRYLGMIGPGPQKDLLADPAALDNLLKPAAFSPARWPGPGRHPLVLLQQAAVNGALQATPEKGILAVNGPPGTGKTTLLRDVVAGVVTQRAEAMCAFNHPQDAFVDSNEKLSVGNAYLRLHYLDPRIKGHELLIASSNNKAVENVSAELPGLEAIAADATDLRYFTCLSDALLNRPSWGLIAAVLGNASNKYRFSQTFWWDPEVGIATYLAEIIGTPQWIDEIDPDTGNTIGKHKPRIVTETDPPGSPAEAEDRWHAAKKRFEEALAASRSQLSLLTNIRDLLLQIPFLEQKRTEAEGALKTRQQQYDGAQQALGFARTALNQLTAACQVADANRLEQLSQRPGFWARLFHTRRFRDWLTKHREGTSQYATVRRAEAEQAREVGDHEQAVAGSQSSVQNARSTIAGVQANQHALDQSLAAARSALPATWLDPAFFRQAHEVRHLSVPWCDAATHRLRDNVFARALDLHKAFIDAAAKPLKHNLGALMYVFSKGALPDETKMTLLGDLWSSLFLVVPVLSTTFASVQRLLGNLPPASLGWLLVDEAGQAPPQAAVGAMIRTRRAVVVGDPLQIEPVVALPELLTTTICQHFGADPLVFNPPKASVQTLADAATPYYAEFESINGSRVVGVPLLVHRRCAEPMFGISNTIAYARLMVSAKTPGPSAIRDCLGPSTWLDVQGTAVDKWCPEEGAVVLQLLTRLRSAGIKPDLFILTPFTVVSRSLRTLVEQSGVLKGWVDQPDRWLSQHIGTVHTVQGREAQAVIFVLGAPAPTEKQIRSRGWAGGTPNLLNVAVTRAKEVVYVVGNRRLWATVGVFRRLTERLP